MIWREKRILLGVLAVLLLANTVFFFTYRVQYEKRLQALEERREASEARLVQERSERLTAERRVASYKKVQNDLQQVYTKQWATEEERLTALIIEVKRLAVASQLIPRAYSFSREGDEKRPTRGTAPGATVVGVTFAVEGNYQQVRRLINLLELSTQFIIIDQITLASADGQLLTLNLQLKTLFRDDLPKGTRSRDL